jgi:hypothetical protein
MSEQLQASGMGFLIVLALCFGWIGIALEVGIILTF